VSATRTQDLELLLSDLEAHPTNATEDVIHIKIQRGSPTQPRMLICISKRCIIYCERARKRLVRLPFVFSTSPSLEAIFECGF